VTGFSNEEEQAIGLASVVPFLLEDRLRERGGLYRRGPLWAPHVEVDGQLVTGQNPASSVPVARSLLDLLRA
jgi:putative intracellular protease/amidase